MKRPEPAGASLATRKARLETQIEQQRVDLLVAANRWREAAAAPDEACLSLMRFKGPLLALGGWLLYRGTRRPGGVARLGRRLAAGAVLASRTRRWWRRLR